MNSRWCNRPSKEAAADSSSSSNRPPRGSRWSWKYGAFVLLAVLIDGRAIHAGCNIIPGTANIFRGALGTVDRPFGLPGDFVAVALQHPCFTASTGFSATPDDHVVTVVFTPPAGPRHLVALTTDCAA